MCLKRFNDKLERNRQRMGNDKIKCFVNFAKHPSKPQEGSNATI